MCSYLNSFCQNAKVVSSWLMDQTDPLATAYQNEKGEVDLQNLSGKVSLAQRDYSKPIQGLEKMASEHRKVYVRLNQIAIRSTIVLVALTILTQSIPLLIASITSYAVHLCAEREVSLIGKESDSLSLYTDILGIKQV